MFLKIIIETCIICNLIFYIECMNNNDFPGDIKKLTVPFQKILKCMYVIRSGKYDYNKKTCILTVYERRGDKNIVEFLNEKYDKCQDCNINKDPVEAYKTLREELADYMCNRMPHYMIKSCKGIAKSCSLKFAKNARPDLKVHWW
ncbi:uncharacterized protein LOC126893874 isoform X2 [Daktulosphaira vitifoliae]|uniref:uncharacterized protein LOC126893874 isoform X2 n=1 Tax=Daktulosphaira vitifoliae TaxID=58002 RepID=UPI0021AA4234|nr:uncharacterized protein LOC126893874 isoform X2 [Daktulosphaira vitifoliae]